MQLQSRTSKHRRRSNLERTTETRRRLLEAALECLHEVGYRGTTIQELTRRAKLSIGSFQYHFASKAELVVAALEQLISERRREFEAALRALPTAADPIAYIIDQLWAVYSGDTYRAYLELVVASRTEPELAAHLHKLGNSVSTAVVDEFRRQLVARPSVARGYEDAVGSLVFGVLEGLAVGRLAAPQRRDYLRTLQLLKRLTSSLVTPAPRTSKDRTDARRKVTPAPHKPQTRRRSTKKARRHPN